MIKYFSIIFTLVECFSLFPPLELVVFSCPQMAWVYQYYICLNCNFKDKLCSLFLLPFHPSHSYTHTRVRLWRLGLWQMLCPMPICFLSLSLFPAIAQTHFPCIISFLCCPYSYFFFYHHPLFSSTKFSLYSFHFSLLLSFFLYCFYISFFSTCYPSPVSPSLFLYSLHSPPSLPALSLLTSSLAVYQASTLSSARWLMLCRLHPSPRCHHSAFKIQSFSETAVLHHLSSLALTERHHWHGLLMPCLDIKQFGHLKHFNSDVFWWVSLVSWGW